MIEQTVQGIPLRFETNSDVFSPEAIDAGTLAMLSQVTFSPADRVLDLGCGYGIVGVFAAKQIGEERVILCDRSINAVNLARTNAALNGLPQLDIRQSDAYETIPETEFTLILSNPPYHANFSVAKSFIEQGYKKLAMGGKMVMVTKRLDWYKNKLTAVFGGVRISEIDGYFVFISEKRPYKKKKDKEPQKLSRKLQRKYGKSVD